MRSLQGLKNKEELTNLFKNFWNITEKFLSKPICIKPQDQLLGVSVLLRSTHKKTVLLQKMSIDKAKMTESVDSLYQQEEILILILAKLLF